MREFHAPELSVIVVVYNCEKYLEKCLRSLELQQVFGGVEFICVNDGSFDRSLEILKSFEVRDSRFKVFSKENGGQSSARNYGLKKALGQYICFVDGDDKVGSRAFTTGKELQNLLDNFDDDINCVVGDIDIVYEANEHMKLSDSSYYKLPWIGSRTLNTEDFFRLHVSVWGRIYRKKIIDKVTLCFPEGLHYEDAYWHMCYSMIAPEYKFSKEKIYTYYRHPSGIMNDTFNKKINLKVFDHVKVASEIYKFYLRNGKVAEYLPFLGKVFEHYFYFAMSHVAEYDKPYVVWGTGKELRELDFDTSGNSLLTSLKTGRYGEFQIDVETLRDARKWRKLREFSYLLLPKDSKLRRLTKNLITCVVKR